MAESFLRNEKKYILSQENYDKINNKLKNFILPDKYPSNQLLTVYYDSDDYKLINKSIEKPLYKEKLRIRSYGPPLDNDKIFVELKRKFDGVVYKQRTKATYKDVLNNIYDCEFDDKQVGKEIKYLFSIYKDLKPKIFISSNRTYYIGKDNNDLRITFDDNLKYRLGDAYLNKNSNDKLLTDKKIMEIKVKGAFPLWLSRILNELKIYPTSYSKVGNAYLKEKEEQKHGTIKNNT